MSGLAELTALFAACDIAQASGKVRRARRDIIEPSLPD